MDTKKIETVLTTVTIDSKVDSGKIDVVVGESAKMDVVKAVNYIQSGKAEIEAGVTEVLSQVDNHVAEKTAEFDQNAQDKTDAFNSNAVEKTGDFNDNYTDKLNAFNQNAQDKTDAFDDNASDKTGDFDTNATAKTTDFNDNYAEKKALIDAEVAVAEGYSAEAKQWAIGEPTEPAEGSAKYWAEQASKTLPNDGQLDIQVNGSSIATFTANQATNTTANIVVPDSATWGNITGTLSNQTDLQTALDTKANDSDVVHKTGNETIAGNKSFTSTIIRKVTNMTAGTPPAASTEAYALRIQDSANKTLGLLTYLYQSSGGGYVYLRAYNPADTSKYSQLKIGYDSGGNAYTEAPTPATSDNSTKIATTAFVKAQGYATTEMLNSKQDVIEDLADIRDNATTGAGLAPQVEVNTQRIEDLTVAKFPNVVIVGTPHIEGGQVSNYSDTNYLQFPFVDISRGQPFDIYFSFTTAQDITTQQNILDAHFGIALAVQNGKGVMALSSNGTSWDIGTSVGTNTLLPNTTYYVKYSWTGTEYSAALSTDDQTYVPDMNLSSTLSPYKTTIFIGGSPNIFGAGSAHPFKGTINFNKSKVVVNGITVWEGMADVGLASRANVSLNNLDEVGEARFNAKQDKLIAGDNITIENNVISSAGGAVDNKSITKNTDNQIQAVGVIEKNTGAVKYDWIGTLAEYNAQNVETLHPDWVCFITDDVSGGTSVYTKTEVDNAISTALTAMLDSAFPVGYRYITEASTCPLATLIPNSTWVLTSQGRVIQGADSNHASGTTAEAGLPNIEGNLYPVVSNSTNSSDWITKSGVFTNSSGNTSGAAASGSTYAYRTVNFDASKSNSIYGNSTTVQPPAEFVNIYKRIA